MFVVILMVVFSGCVSISQPNSANQNPAHQIPVSNIANSSHTVSVTVIDGNETIFTESKVLAPGETHLFTTITEPGTYRIKVTTEHQTKSVTVNLPIAGLPNSTTAVFIRENGSLSITTHGQDYGQ